MKDCIEIQPPLMSKSCSLEVTLSLCVYPIDCGSTLPLVSIGKKIAHTEASKPKDPYTHTAAVKDLSSKTCATKGVNMAPTRAQAEAIPIPSVLMVVGYTSAVYI